MVLMQSFPFEFGFGSSVWTYWIPGIILVIIVPQLLNSYRRSRAFPPGPRRLPVLGNILQVPLKMPWFKFTEWAQEFGPVFSLSILGQPVIILSTFKAGADLFDRHSNIYSDRPRFVMASEILTGGMNKSLIPYGNLWRKMRRAAHEGFSLRSAEKYQPAQAREASLAAMQILETPEAWENHLERAAAGSILSAVYGRRNNDQRVFEQMRAYVRKLAESLIPGAYLVDIIPALKYAPLWIAKWKREGLKWHQNESERFEGLITEVEEKMLSGRAPAGFVSDLIETKDRHGLSDKEVAWLAGSLLSAGADTTAGTLLYFILAMVLYPETMHKAQAELDHVVGRERIPTFEDQKNLPYIETLVKELLRWRPIAPLSIPRAVTEDNWYEGYLIPKGAIIIPNIWLMNRDPKLFPDFDEFRPDRFLNEIPEDTHSMGHGSFGFGRRMCVGYSFANQMLFITIATLLWALNIEKAKDSEGNIIVPSRNDLIDTGIVCIPAPFKCKFSPRFPGVLSVLQREMPAETRLEM